MNLIIKQSNTPESVTSEIIDRLYNLTKPDPITGQPAANAVLVGRLEAPAAYEDAVNFLNTQFSSGQDNGSDLRVSVLNNNYFIRFADPEVESVLIDAGVIQEGEGLTVAKAATSTFNRELFANNQLIEHFDEFKYFTKMNQNTDTGGLFNGCVNLISTDLTNITKLYWSICKNCNSLIYFNGEDGPEYTLSLPNLTQTNNTSATDAFAYCTTLKHIISLGIVPRLEGGTFRGCTNLEDVTLPSQCANLQGSCFQDCSKLSVINLSQLTIISGNAFNACSSLEYCDGPNSTQGELNLPNLTGTLGGSAFKGCTKLTSIASLGNITTIGSYAFENCGNLATINFPSTITSVGASAFNNTAWYNSQPDGLVCIGNVLYKCKNISGDVVIPNNIVSIADEAFRNCSGVTSVAIPDNVTRINDYTFYGCTGLASMIIPSNITSIGSNAFEECANLVSLTIPNSVASMGNSAFRHCFKLKALHFPSGATSIPYGCCSDDYELEDVVIPEGYTTINQYAFTVCRSLQAITLPSTITNIGPKTIAWCNSLTEMTVLATNPPTISSNSFEGDDNLTSIYVPASSVDTYKSASGWSTYASRIKAIPTT